MFQTQPSTYQMFMTHLPSHSGLYKRAIGCYLQWMNKWVMSTHPVEWHSLYNKPPLPHSTHHVQQHSMYASCSTLPNVYMHPILGSSYFGGS